MSVASINSTLLPSGNFSNDSSISLAKEPSAVRVFRLLFQTVTFLVGSVGNIFVCIITSRKRNLKIVGNRFILNLAIADLGILLVSFPLHILSIDFPFSWPFGEFVCRTIFPFTDIFYGVEIGCITAIAFHRYRMLVHCMKPQMTAQTAKRVLFLIWLLSFIILVMPLLFVIKLVKIPRREILSCEADWPNIQSMQTYYLSSFLAFYVVPLVVIFLTYVRIRTKLRDNIRKHDSIRRASFKEKTPGKREEISRVVQNRRALKLLTPVVLAFAICMAPVQLYRVLSCFIQINSFILVRFILLLLIANSSINPIFYSVVNSEFRREFSRLLRCRGENCCADTTEGLSLSTFRRSSSMGRPGNSKRSSFLLRRMERSSSSSRKSSKSAASRNSAEKIEKAGDGREEPQEAVKE